MTGDELNEIEQEVQKEIGIIKLRESSYIGGLQEGVNLAFRTMYKRILENSKNKEGRDEDNV